MKTGTGSSHGDPVPVFSGPDDTGRRQSRGASILRGGTARHHGGAGDGGYTGGLSAAHVPADPYRAFFPDDRDPGRSTCCPCDPCCPNAGRCDGPVPSPCGAAPLLVAILGAVHPFAPLKLALLPHLFPVVVPVGHKRVLRSGGVGRDGNVRRVRQKMTGSGCIGVAQGQAGQQRSGTKACSVFHVFFLKALISAVRKAVLPGCAQRATGRRSFPGRVECASSIRLFPGVASVRKISVNTND